MRDPATLYTYNLSPLSNKLFSTASNGYQYSLYICSKGDSAGDQCGDAGACQTKDSSSHSLGNLNSTLSFANGSLQLRYVGGDSCSGGVRRSTLVSFACDLNSTGIKEVSYLEWNLSIVYLFVCTGGRPRGLSLFLLLRVLH